MSHEPSPSPEHDRDLVTIAVADHVAVVTLCRPESRNALSSALLGQLRDRLTEAEQRDDVHATVLTGADPAFCAGLDLYELGSTGNNLTAVVQTADQPGPFPRRSKPLIGAINGVAVTGGLELALNCDFLVASERARFGDTHARVGVMPGWGLTVLLPQAVGLRRAREMSLTGRYVDAHEAAAWGLVNHVVAHAELLPTAVATARAIAEADQAAVRELLDVYREVHDAPNAWDVERRRSESWRETRFDPGAVAARRAATQAHGRQQADRTTEIAADSSDARRAH